MRVKNSGYLQSACADSIGNKICVNDITWMQSELVSRLPAYGNMIAAGINVIVGNPSFNNRRLYESSECGSGKRFKIYPFKIVVGLEYGGDTDLQSTVFFSILRPRGTFAAMISVLSV